MTGSRIQGAGRGVGSLAGGGFDILRQPIEALHQSLPRSSTAGLHLPHAAGKLFQLQPLLHFPLSHRLRQILLVGKDEDDCVGQLSRRQDPVQLDACLVDPISILTVNHKDERFGARVVVPPQRADLVLAADILLALELELQDLCGCVAIRRPPTQT